MSFSLKAFCSCGAAAVAVAGFASHSLADGHIVAGTVVSAPHGTYNGVAYRRYEAMFEGVSSNHRAYRVPCQIIAPVNHGGGGCERGGDRGLLLFDWLVPTTIGTAVGQEQADARYTLGDEFMFGRGGGGVTYATVRCDPAGIGTSSPIAHPARPWSDNLLNTSSEFITSAGDEFDIVVDYVKALRADPIARAITGRITRTAAFGYSASGFRLRGLLRLDMGRGLFDFALVGGAGKGYSYPTADGVETTDQERPPLHGTGREIDFHSEFDVIAFDAGATRHEEPNYRVYQFAGASHIRNIDVAEFGLADPETANPADWVPFFRALFVAGDRWCDGVAPPPSLWLGRPNQAEITRDASGNALVTHIGGRRVSTTAYRLPEVAVGQNQYIAIDPSYNDGTLAGFLRMTAGGHVDLTANFTNHAAYVAAVAWHARFLQAQRYLLPQDADAIIRRAAESNIGR